jgi:hypothetical protein
MKPAEFTFPFRSEFESFGNLAAEAVNQYLFRAPFVGR